MITFKSAEIYRFKYKVKIVIPFNETAHVLLESHIISQVTFRTITQCKETEPSSVKVKIPGYSYQIIAKNSIYLNTEPRTSHKRQFRTKCCLFSLQNTWFSTRTREDAIRQLTQEVNKPRGGVGGEESTAPLTHSSVYAHISYIVIILFCNLCSKGNATAV